MYTANVFAITDEQREIIAEEGTPLPIADDKKGKAYVVLQVSFGRTEDKVFRAVAPGVNAVGEGDIPSDALFSLCAAIQMLAKNPPEERWGAEG